MYGTCDYLFPVAIKKKVNPFSLELILSFRTRPFLMSNPTNLFDVTSGQIADCHESRITGSRIRIIRNRFLRSHNENSGSSVYKYEVSRYCILWDSHNPREGFVSGLVRNPLVSKARGVNRKALYQYWTVRTEGDVTL